METELKRNTHNVNVNRVMFTVVGSDLSLFFYSSLEICQSITMAKCNIINC